MRITRKNAYIIGVTTIILLTVVNQFLIQRVINEHKFDATVINLAGRQRMLSQKISKEVYRLTDAKGSLETLQEQVREWDLVHKGIQKGNDALGLPVLESEEIKNLFVELEPFHRAISEAILGMSSLENLESVAEIIENNEGYFLEIMDTIVNTLESESRKRISGLILLEFVLALFSLIVLLLEITYIFRPLNDHLRKEKTHLQSTLQELVESKGSLFQATQRFDLSIQAINAGIWDWNILDGSEWWSKKFYTLLGYSNNEIPATYSNFLNQLVHPEDKKRVEDAVSKHLEDRIPYKIETRMKTKNGGYRWFESVGQATWDEGKPVRMVGSIIDIDEKKQFEDQLSSDKMLLDLKTRELEKIISDFNRTQEVAKIGIWDVDIKSMTSNWSDEVYRIHEIEVGTQIKVEDGINFYREDYREIIQEAVNSSISENTSWDLECVLVTAKGNEVWVRTIGYPVFEGGQLDRLHGLFMDIDEKKQFENQLSHDKSLLDIKTKELEKIISDFNRTQEVAKIGIWDLDIRSNTVNWSDEVYRIHEIEVEIPIKVEEGINFYREDYRAIVQEAIDSSISENKTWDIECVLMTAKGNEIWVRAIGYPIFEGDQLIRLRGLFMDIDEQKRAQIVLEEQKKELEEITTKLSLAVNTGKIGVWLWDLETNDLEWDDQMLDIFGITREEFTNGYDSYAELVLPEDLPTIESGIEQAIKNRERFDADFRIKKKDGSIGYLVAKADLILDADEKPVKMIGINYDVTDLKSTEKTMIEAQEVGKIGNWVWDIEKNIIEWSSQTYKVLGQEKDFESTFENLLALTHPDDRKSLQENVEQAVEKNQPYDLIHRILLDSGEIRYIHERGKVFYAENGTPLRMAGTSQDVTEIEIGKRALEQRERQLRRFVEQAPVAVAMLDKDMKYLSVSNQWYKEYGIEEKSIIGKCHYDVFPEIRKNQAWLDDHQNVLNGEELSNARDKFVREDGAIQYLSWKLIPWTNSDNEINGMIMYTADITNEVKYQEKLENLNEILENQVERRTTELKEANKELESFSYSVSHDLRAPLRSISGFSDILKEDYEDQLDDEGKRLIEIIRNSAVSMGELIDGILDFSKLGRKSLKTEKINMNNLFSDLIEGQTQHFNVASKLDVKLPPLPNAMGDLAMLKQAILNLVGNAFKYSMKKDRIEIEIGAKTQGNHIVYFIKDNGAGFDSEKYQNKIFGVFQRLHSQNEFEGTGVGLAIVKRIIEKHGGKVWAESQLQKGATFFFTLPKTDNE